MLELLNSGFESVVNEIRGEDTSFSHLPAVRNSFGFAALNPAANQSAAPTQTLAFAFGGH